MAGTTTHPSAFRTTVADLVTSTLSTTAKLKFRTTGTAGSPGTAVATLPLSNPVGAGASAGVLTLSAITSDTNAAGGTIATATLETGAGTVVVHCTVGTSGDAINVTSGGLAVTAGDTVSCSSLTYTAMP
jgi:hypothetical protein